MAGRRKSGSLMSLNSLKTFAKGLGSCVYLCFFEAQEVYTLLKEKRRKTRNRCQTGIECDFCSACSSCMCFNRCFIFTVGRTEGFFEKGKCLPLRYTRLLLASEEF